MDRRTDNDKQMDSWTDGHNMDCKTGGPVPTTGRQADMRTGGQADRRTGGQADRRTGGQADRRTGGQADRTTNCEDSNVTISGKRLRYIIAILCRYG